jgi:uncharacterized protein YdhG (YjbR/CyaY superfamily)
MEVFDEYLAQIENPQHRARLEEILQLVRRTFPRLEPRFAWNQPMFTDHGTFIIAFSVAAHHIAFALEAAGLQQFLTEIDQAGYSHGAKFIRIRWEQPVDYALLQRMIEFNIQEKSDCKTFWRKITGCGAQDRRRAGQAHHAAKAPRVSRKASHKKTPRCRRYHGHGVSFCDHSVLRCPPIWSPGRMTTSFFAARPAVFGLSCSFSALV